MTARRLSGEWGDTLPQSDGLVDVLIPTIGSRPAELAATLAGLAAQDDPAFDIVISDQSVEGAVFEEAAVLAMLRVLRAQGHHVELHRHLPRRGLAEQRQFLLDRARAEFVLFLDDDIWLEPDSLHRMVDAIEELRCGFVGLNPQGLSAIDDRRPHDTAVFEEWEGPVLPERMRSDAAGFERKSLHVAANLLHVAADRRLGLADDRLWVAYKIAWLGACTLYRRSCLVEVGGFDFWPRLPADHAGEDVAAQWRVMERFGGAGLVPSGAVHMQSATTVEDRSIEARDILFPNDPSGEPDGGADTLNP
ncbi:glycosyltransferase family 2 protein [Herbiconiux sp. L3-i23]|uniref:glycosyltransferase family 2 protein n=1 Tax=Herbiconiux sp. L3-i23 TaxID=2905871 RepID=UPI002046C9A1|nr:glycosyltransferase family 2 protein [Herbiconiux sp. L3-i23]BDI23326.1 hypothetical protein L3i23_21020 [Herbiconiux sp. L3-i23]